MDDLIIDKAIEKRFKNGIEAQKSLLDLTRTIQDRLLSFLPSNYPKDRNTNLGEFFRAVAKEFARLQTSISDINEDKYHNFTPPEYLFQILGDLLFLGENAVNESFSDVDYRNFLISIRNAYFGGSRKDNIEKAISDILGIPVHIKELYLDLRTQSSFYGLKDTHTMFFDILMDQAPPSSQIGTLLKDLSFYIDILKPAHVLYDTRLIWNEAIGTEKSCTPTYITTLMPYVAYGTSRVDMVTYLASKIYKFSGTDPHETWEQGTIAALNTAKGIIDLTDNRILVYDTDTVFYYRDILGHDTVITIDQFHVGDIVKYYAVKDIASSSEVIKSDWAYSGLIASVDESSYRIILTTGGNVVCNKDTLIYTRDTAGEYRIDFGDLRLGHEITFKAQRYTDAFEFYKTPPVVQTDFFEQFDDEVIEKPIFQEYVKKEKEIPPGTTEGWDVEVIDGVATLVEIKSEFYKRANAKAERMKEIYRYNLYIDHNDGNGLVFTDQFSQDDPQKSLTDSEAKAIFITQGYTGLQDPRTIYEIESARTGKLVEDGPDAQVQAIDDHTEMCERKASCQLVPFYEDFRKYYPWPDLRLTSGFFTVEPVVPFVPQPTIPGQQDLPAAMAVWYYVSATDNSYIVPLLPMLNAEGQPATPADLTVYINGLLVQDAVDVVDPWNGIVSLNFIPPYDSKIRIDYQYAKRYPDPVYQLVKVLGTTETVLPGDLLGQFTVIHSGGLVKRLSWPYPLIDTSLYGDDRDYQMNDFPMLNNKGVLATKDDVFVFVGNPVASGHVTVVSVDPNAGTTFHASDFSVLNVLDGDTVILEVKNYLDNTLVYTISGVDNLANTFTVPNIGPNLTGYIACSIVRFVEVLGAVMSVRPLFGHVRIDFIPPLGTTLKFVYHYTPQPRNYLTMPDVATVADPFWDYTSTDYTLDTFYGSMSDYSLLFDHNPDHYLEPFWTFTALMKIGYRYRVYNLSSSSVLNSTTLLTNDYQKPGTKGSFKSHDGLIRDYDLMFSPEYLQDTAKDIILNEQYLEKDIPAATTLNPGIPPFVKSFTDTTRYHRGDPAQEHDTYDPTIPDAHDLPAGFTIVGADTSGIIDYDSVCGYPDNGKLKLYSDLKMKEFEYGDFDAPLSTIDDAGSALPFKFTYIEQYYPNREMRLNDYLDYINQVPTDYKTGHLKVLNQSSIIKSIEGVFRALRVGDTFAIKQVPFQEWVGVVGGDISTGHWEAVYKNPEYVLIEIIDFETGRINGVFDGPSGEYAYDLTSNKTYAVDVYLNELQRTLVLNGDIHHSYSIPDNILMHFPGYGVTGMGYNLYFRDRDGDPTPAMPDNPWLANPTGIMYYDIGNQTEYRIESGVTYSYPVRANRTRGTTGIVLTSQILNDDGSSLGLTGIFSGVTGPSGALDLGITGPIDTPNPREIKPQDEYFIPSGDTGTYLSYSEAEYRVQWRNWDQEMFLVWLGDNGVVKELPLNLMDDLGVGIKRYYWDVQNVVIKEIYYHGSLLETSEKVVDSVAAITYPYGLIVLNQDAVDAIKVSANPVVDLPYLHLGDAIYQLNRRIVREVLHDDSIKATEIQELVAII